MRLLRLINLIIILSSMKSQTELRLICMIKAKMKAYLSH